MVNSLFNKIKEALLSVLPVVAIVLVMYFTPLVSLTGRELTAFCISSVLLVIGIGLFNLGADIAMTPMGEYVGAGLVKSKRSWLLPTGCFCMGVLITVAEPDLSVLAEQVASRIDATTLIVTVGVGVGAFLVCAVLRIVFKLPLSSLLTFFYMCLFALTAILAENGGADFIPLAFDSGGVTTGPITVPFIMALGIGISQSIGGKNAGENSFGLVSLCSVGPVLAVIALGLGSSGSTSFDLPEYGIADNLAKAYLTGAASVTKEVAIALGLIVAFFLVLQFTVLKLPKKKLWRIGIGIAYTFVGLVVFLTAVNVGYMPIGYKLGAELGNCEPWIIVVFGFVLGAMVVLAEPAVHVLNKQVEEVTGGAISKRSMTIALCVGVGISIALSMLRIVLGFSILYYLIPGYILSLGLSFFVPKIYTAIAFDSGGVASGPLTSGFILPLATGVCVALGGNVLTDAFGIVAMVAMTPLITIQILGFRAVVAKKLKNKIAQNRILNADDEQIIEFM